MKAEDEDEALPEYDFSKAVHGKYYERYRAGTSEERGLQERRAAAIDAILELHRGQLPLSDEEIARARKADRP